MTAKPIIELRGVSKHFTKRLSLTARIGNLLGGRSMPQTVRAVDDVSLAITKGEVVGLVGESGCGKSTLGRIAVGLHAPTAGDRHWQGKSVLSLSPSERRAVQLAGQMIFQDAYASLNPRLRVADIIGEAPLAHGLITAAAEGEYVGAMMQRVGLDPSLAHRYPHQFSGGQRARIGIARALAVRPEFLVCDEAVAALDVSIQAQVINLFLALRGDLGLTYLFISHDLGVVRHIADRVVIMYLGRVVEAAPTEAFFASPNHPYAKALIAEVPRLDVRRKNFVAVTGEIPSPLAPPRGCHFHPRCPHVMPKCRIEAPSLRVIAPDRFSACHLNDQT
ncbi:MAG: ABC transporter ATP-binding protein [Betaproteobacteria bacterium]|nr:ABC transporter ATP-binding protein [Betaproteobacteria bacterium]